MAIRRLWQCNQSLRLMRKPSCDEPPLVKIVIGKGSNSLMHARLFGEEVRYRRIIAIGKIKTLKERILAIGKTYGS